MIILTILTCVFQIMGLDTFTVVRNIVPVLSKQTDMHECRQPSRYADRQTGRRVDRVTIEHYYTLLSSSSELN